MNKNLLKVMVSELVRIGTAPLRLLPIKNNRILFTGLTGGKSYAYSCNPKYLYEYLRDNYPGVYEYVWAVEDKERYSFLEEEGVKLVKHFTVSSFPMLLTSKIIVTNGSYAPWFPFRKSQYVINTWHGGGAYKKVENEAPGADWATKKRAAFCANNIDLFLASCKTQEEQMIKTTYQYQGEVLRTGTPRNDKLVRGEIAEAANKVRKFYDIPQDAKLVLYAPTYRNPSVPVELDSDRLIEALDGLEQDTRCRLLEHAVEESPCAEMENHSKWYFLNRYHRYMDDNMEVRVKGKQVVDVMDYPDMQELLCAADMLITDYSSCVWDYMFLKRPCFLYVPDKEEYTAKTGFYVGMDEWPFAQADTMETLLQMIKQYQPKQAIEGMKKHAVELGSYESGECCTVLAQLIEKESGRKNG